MKNSIIINSKETVNKAEQFITVFKYTFISTIIILGALIIKHAIDNPHLIFR